MTIPMPRPSTSASADASQTFRSMDIQTSAQADGHQGGPSNGKVCSAPKPAYDVAACHRGNQHAEHHRHELKPRACRALAFHDLEYKLADTSLTRTARGPAISPIALVRTKVRLLKQAQGQDWFTRFHLDRDKGGA